jgi:hypothetical protein
MERERLLTWRAGAQLPLALQLHGAPVVALLALEPRRQRRRAAR